MFSFWKTTIGVLLSWSVYVISSFNIQILKMSLLESSVRDSVIVIILAFLGFFWIIVSAHQPICSRGSSVLCDLMVEVLSKSSKNSKGNIMVCNYFWIGTIKDWYIWMLPFSHFLWNLLNKKAVFPQIFYVKHHAIFFSHLPVSFVSFLMFSIMDNVVSCFHLQDSIYQAVILWEKWEWCPIKKLL